jgi:hypothetical protein
MRVLTAIGEIGITAKSRDFLFRPSLYAMSLLDDPVKLFADIHQEGGTKEAEHSRFLAAIEVIQCCIDEDITHLIGHTGSRPDRWVPGLINHEKIIVLASSLIRHGLIGPKFENDDIGTKKKEFSEKFDPAGIVSLAIAHLGVSEADAWNMTITGFLLAMRAKFPPQPRTRPNVKELDAMMDWLEKVNAAEKAQKQ